MFLHRTPRCQLPKHHLEKHRLIFLLKFVFSIIMIFFPKTGRLNKRPLNIDYFIFHVWFTINRTLML